MRYIHCQKQLTPLCTEKALRQHGNPRHMFHEREALRLADIRRRAQLNDCLHKDRANNNNQWSAIRRRWAGEKKESSWQYWWDDFLTREEILELPPYGYNNDHNPSRIPHGNQLALDAINGVGRLFIPAERPVSPSARN